jgi:hypothetical protein
MTKISAVEVLTACQDGDVVYLNWPDGTKTLVKGHAFLDRVVRTGKAEDVRFFSIPVSTETEADVIEAVVRVIEDGDFHLGAEAVFFTLLAEAREGPAE